MRPSHLFDQRLTAHDGDISRSLQRQSPPHLIANVGDIHIRIRSTENDLFHWLPSGRKEYAPYQAPNLFAGEVLRIPTVRVASDPEPRQLSFLSWAPDQFGAAKHVRTSAHLISFTPTTAYPFLPVAKPGPDVSSTPMHLPVCAAQGSDNLP